MLIYLIKSGACLGILYLFYKLFLEKENMHVFKRFYLLAALALAIIIPALVFTEYVEAPATTNAEVLHMATTNDKIHAQPALKADVSDIAPILWGIYFIGLLFFGMRFVRNLLQIFGRIRSNPKYRLARFTQVLLQERIPPHTFFSYIFLNKTKLEANEIPQEVLLHEETHAHQKHSWDVVFVELLQVIFWVNPFIYLSKKAIKLNHEFLADQAVLKKDIHPTTYQNTLLSYLSPDSEKKYQPKLANAINYSSYSSIKKRFTIMKTNTSRKSILIKSLLLVPLLALLLYGFSDTKVETISPPAIVNSTNIDTPEILEEGILRIRISKKGEIVIEGQKISMGAVEEHLKKVIQRDAIKRAFILPDHEAPLQVVEEVNTMLGQLQLAQINIIGPEKPSDTGHYQGGATKTELATFNALAKKYNKQPKATRVVPLKDLKTLESVFRKMTEAQRSDAEPFPECDPINQEGATQEQIDEYNALAKKYNRQISDKKNIRIFKTEVERLEYLYGLMTREQRDNAEPLPDFPEPPPPPHAPKMAKVNKGEKGAAPPPPPPAPNLEQQKSLAEKSETQMRVQQVEMEEQETLMKEQKVQMKEQETLMKEQETLMKEQEVKMKEQETLMKEERAEIEKMEEEMEAQVYELPPPPPPQAPLDHLVEMAKKDAVFYHQGNKITSDEAIAILKNNKSINIDTRGSKSDRPVVRLSTEPITIDN